MTKIVCNDGTEEFLSPGAAHKKVAAGEAVFAQGVPMYSTRQLTAESPKATPKTKAKKKEQPQDDDAAI
tara:strand:- start:1756 stop:1962 length:207 start_codon:yes stop_codon:yes gene_type:complete